MDGEFRSYVVEGQQQAGHSHQEIELDYVLQGNIVCNIARNPYQMAEGDVILVNSNALHSWACAHDCLLFRVYVSSAMVSRQVGRGSTTFWCNSVASDGRDMDALREALNTLVSECVTSQGRESFAYESAKYRLLDLLVSDYAIAGCDSWADIGDERIRDVLDYVDVHYDGPVALKAVAKNMFVSEAYLSRLFKEVVGVNFHEYVNRVRLNHALEELLYTSASVAQISAHVGFSNPSAFNKVFKKAFSCSPTTYRKAAGGTTPNVREEDSLAEQSSAVWKRTREWVAAHESDSAVPRGQLEHVVLDAHPSRPYTYDRFAAVDMDMLSDLLQGPVQRHVVTLHGQVGIAYVRVSNIFERGMRAVSPGTSYLNYSYVDAALDFLVENGLRPIVNLTFARKRVYGDFGSSLFCDESPEWVPAKNIQEWRLLMEGLVVHLVDRYGIGEVSSWLFEIEYNADYHVYCEETHRVELPYSELWRVAYEAIKGAYPTMLLGGDHRLIGRDELPFPDFIAIGELPFRRRQTDGDIYSQRTTNLLFLEDAVRELRRDLMHAGHADTLILVSTWTTSVSERNAYNDSCGKGAHILMHLINLESENCLLCYHHGSDYLSQLSDTNAPLSGANGLLTRDGIAKPAFFALLLMKYAHGNVVAKGRNHLALRTDSGHVFVVLHNAKDFGHRYFLMRESEIGVDSLAGIYSDDEDMSFVIESSYERDGAYRLTRISLSPSEGCVLTEWDRMGSPDSLDATMTEYLRHVCRPRMQGVVLHAQNGVLRFRLTLQPNEICLLRLSRIHTKEGILTGE